MGAPTGAWRHAIVREVVHPHPRAVILRLEVPDRIDHWPGQHYVVRLTAEDGYTASRSYSVSSAPEEPLIELYIERLEGGEVSGYLADVAAPGDGLEIRGPIGGWFVWDGSFPAVGIGGGTGVAPLVGMLRHAQAAGRTDQLQLVAAARTRAELPYADELTAAHARIALSREAAPDGRAAGRLRASELAQLVAPDVTYFVCGSAVFAESVSELLVELGAAPRAVRVERFGPSG